MLPFEPTAGRRALQRCPDAVTAEATPPLPQTRKFEDTSASTIPLRSWSTFDDRSSIDDILIVAGVTCMESAYEVGGLLT